MKIVSLTSPEPDVGPCARARAQASAWIDGELVDASEWNAHFERCAECRTHLADLRRTMGLLAPMRREERATDLWPRIAEAALASRVRSPASWMHRALRLVAALVGFAGTVYLLRATAVERNIGPAVQRSAAWTAPLHAPQQDLRRLDASAERLFLASLGRTAEEPR
jgi:anti-sigma factor RsiW